MAAAVLPGAECGAEATAGGTDDTECIDIVGIDSKYRVSVTDEDVTKVCIFCKSSKLDVINWGRMYGTDEVYTHYFCMLFSADLRQNGTDEQGILGFLSQDILKEMRRSRYLKCSFCGEPGASIGCCNKRCKVKFHFPCGLENGARNQFHSTFQSFCHAHSKVEPIVLDGTIEACPICMSTMDQTQKLLKGTCCKASVFHKECIQRMALSAGYLFKCPTCNKTKQFVHEMRSLGIFVPDQDASWERDNRFDDLYLRYANCDATTCLCSGGRNKVDEKGSWSLAVCRLCGAAGTHKKCGMKVDVTKWACPSCLEVEQKTFKSKLIPDKVKRPVKPRGGGSSTRRRPTAARSRKKKLSSPAVPKTIPVVDPDDDNFSLANCRVSSHRYSYFPYPPSQLRRMAAHTNTLSDWRDYQLRVNLVDWIPTMWPRLSQSEEPKTPLGPSTSASSSIPMYSLSCGSGCSARNYCPRSRSPSLTLEEMEANELMADIAQMELEETEGETLSEKTEAQLELEEAGELELVQASEATGQEEMERLDVDQTRAQINLEEAQELELKQPPVSQCVGRSRRKRIFRTFGALGSPYKKPRSSALLTVSVNTAPLTETEIFDSDPDTPTNPTFDVESALSEILKNVEAEVSSDRDLGPPIASVMTMDIAEQKVEMNATKQCVDAAIGGDDVPMTTEPGLNTEPETVPDAERTPEQVNLIAIGGRVRNELSQNRENELSPPNTKLPFFSEFHELPKQWFSDMKLLTHSQE